MERESDGSTHSDLTVDGEVSCRRCFMIQTLLMKIFRGQRKIELQGIKGPGGFCGTNHNLMEPRMILEKTVLEGLSHLFRF